MGEQIKKCPRCLALNPVLAVYCLKCGFKFEEHEGTEKQEKARVEQHVNYFYGGQLYESIITPEGLAAFLTYRDGEGFNVEKEVYVVDEEGKPLVIQPAGRDIPYRPYVISRDLNKPVDLSELWDKVVGFIKKRVVAPVEYIYLFAFDTFLSYLQECFEAVHYLYLVGDTESGKTRVLDVLNMLCFRPLETVDMPPADIYEYLGRNTDLCRGIILEDEAEDLASNSEKRRIWKAGYKKGGRVARIITVERTGERRQQYYNVFCFKAAAAEKTPEGVKAKGLLERCIVLNMLHGVPERKDLTEEDWNEAQLIRFELLKMRLKYFNKIKTEEEYHILVGSNGEMRRIKLKGRDRELFAPILTLGSFLGKWEEAEKVASFFVSQRLKAKIQAHEYYIGKTLMKMVEEERKTKEKEQIEYIEFTPTEGFEVLREIVDGEFDELGEVIKSPLLEGRITKDYFGKRLKDVFKGERLVSKRDERTIRVWRIKVENIRAVLSKYDWLEEIEEKSEIQPPLPVLGEIQAPIEKATGIQAQVTSSTRLPVIEGAPTTPVTSEKPTEKECKEGGKEEKEGVTLPITGREVEEVTTAETKPVHPEEAETPVAFAEAPKFSVSERVLEKKEQLLKWCESFNLAHFDLYRRFLLGEIKGFSWQNDVEPLASQILVDEGLKQKIKVEMDKYEGLPTVFKPTIRVERKEDRINIISGLKTDSDVLIRFHNLLSGYLEAEKKKRQLYETPPVKAYLLTSRLYPTEKCYFCESQPIIAQLTYEGEVWVLVCEKCLDGFKRRFNILIEDVRGWRRQKGGDS